MKQMKCVKFKNKRVSNERDNNFEFQLRRYNKKKSSMLIS